MFSVFGKAPKGERLKLIEKAPNYKNGKFQNQVYTPNLTEGYTITGLLKEMVFHKNPDRKPKKIIPSVQTNLFQIAKNEDILVWFGHSSYFMQINGIKFLIDPVLSGNASPFSFSVKAFKGSDIYKPDDIPEIDYLIISHDHYDHLDYKTIKALKNKIGKVICGLGVAAHFEYWGFNISSIIEKNWYEQIELENNTKIYTFPSRHFSGRYNKRNNTLWMSFLIQTPEKKIYLGGDSGYSTHFKEIGKQFGEIDLAILENGQFNMAWHAIHSLPHETLLEAKELNAKRLMPIHSSKFALALHAWNKPLAELKQLNNNNIPLVTPKIGEKVFLKQNHQEFESWWEF